MPDQYNRRCVKVTNPQVSQSTKANYKYLQGTGSRPAQEIFTNTETNRYSVNTRDGTRTGNPSEKRTVTESVTTQQTRSANRNLSTTTTTKTINSYTVTERPANRGGGAQARELGQNNFYRNRGINGVGFNAGYGADRGRIRELGNGDDYDSCDNSSMNSNNRYEDTDDWVQKGDDEKIRIVDVNTVFVGYGRG